jgi:Double-GTPase 2
MNAITPICSDKDCKVQVDGKCRLKHDPVESCPNYAAERDVVDVPSEEEKPRTEVPVGLWASEKMLIPDLAALARRCRVHRVALVGEEKVGKTTLLASIYGMYCKGPFAGLTFAGSETLLAWISTVADSPNEGRS